MKLYTLYNQFIEETDELPYHFTGLIEHLNGTKEWLVNGEPHRENGPAVEYEDGSKFWYIDGERHRIDGPAIEYTDGEKIWYLNDQLHRIDGPAIEYADGTKEWYINGKKVTEQENDLLYSIMKLKGLI